MDLRALVLAFAVAAGGCGTDGARPHEADRHARPAAARESTCAPAADDTLQANAEWLARRRRERAPDAIAEVVVVPMSVAYPPGFPDPAAPARPAPAADQATLEQAVAPHVDAIARCATPLLQEHAADEGGTGRLWIQGDAVEPQVGAFLAGGWSQGSGFLTCIARELRPESIAPFFAERIAADPDGARYFQAVLALCRRDHGVCFLSVASPRPEPNVTDPVAATLALAVRRRVDALEARYRRLPTAQPGSTESRAVAVAITVGPSGVTSGVRVHASAEPLPPALASVFDELAGTCIAPAPPVATTYSLTFVLRW